jgi:hypothetical protein
MTWISKKLATRLRYQVKSPSKRQKNVMHHTVLQLNKYICLANGPQEMPLKINVKSSLQNFLPWRQLE